MANTLTTNPLYIDTAATVTFNRPLLAKRIDWVGPTAIGNSAVITDIGANILTRALAGATLTTVPLWVGPQKLTLKSPFVVATLSAGVILIWY